MYQSIGINLSKSLDAATKRIKILLLLKETIISQIIMKKNL